MKKHISLAAVISILCCLWTAPVHAEGAPTDFSADIISTSSEGTMSMKLYTTAHKTRVEMPQSTMIMRQDLQVMWIMMPEQRMYMEHPIDTAMMAKTSPHIAGEVKREPMGSEVIDGKTAQKFKVTYVTKGMSESVYQWTAGSEMPIRTQALDGSWTVDYKNVTMAPQPASLFEPPAGFQKMALPSMADMMRGMPAAAEDSQ